MKKNDFLIRHIKKLLSKIEYFCTYGAKITLRPYQLEAASAIIESIKHHKGETFVIVFSRQSGKDELIALLESYLMSILSLRDSSIVVGSPTFKPQTINAMDRLESRLKANVLTHGRWKRSAGYIFQIGLSRTYFFSGNPSANVVGATARDLLVINEAQDVSIQVYDKRFAPMAAANNATVLFSGTVWTSNTLLAREIRNAREKEKKDGKKRVFIVDAEAVTKVNPPYGDFVQKEIAKHGRNHPLIRTQYFCEEIDAQAGMFNERRRALMTGDQPAQAEPIPGHIYAMIIDVAGQDEVHLELDGLSNSGRDSVTLDIVDIDLSSLELLQAPTYRVVKRLAWQGEKHIKVFGQICAIADAWGFQRMVIDATGVGEGLWSMLDRKYPGRVLPVYFTAQKKSEIGYRYLAIIETGRFRDCAPSNEVRKQYAYCQSEILIGPQKTMRWGVPNGTRDTETGELVHDDFVLADAMTSELDALEWFITSKTTIIESADVLESMDRNY